MTDVAPTRDAAVLTMLRKRIEILYGDLAESEINLRAAERHADTLDRENTRLRQENDDLTIGLGLADGPRRQLNDVLDVEPALSAALTRGEA